MRQKLKTFLQMRQERPLLFWLRVSALLGVFFLFAVKRNFWTPDTLFVVLLALFIVFGQARSFLLRFGPFVILMLVYEAFRGVADDLNNFVHYTEMVDFDRFVFAGAVPTAWLQDLMWFGSVSWYDFYFYFLYTIHFLMPVLVAILLWKTRVKMYWPFVSGLVLLSFGAFVTYIIFPAAPPWMASDMGIIEPIHRVSSDIWAAMGVTNFSELYAQISPNEVAAVPSLHSAYPLYIVMFVCSAYGWRKCWWLMFYPISMWIGVVYLGEHYVMDVVLGALYALAAVYGIRWFFAWADGKYWRFEQKLINLFG